MKYSWKTYNLKRINLSKKIIKFNRKNKFNYIENGPQTALDESLAISKVILHIFKEYSKHNVANLKEILPKKNFYLAGSLQYFQ